MLTDLQNMFRRRRKGVPEETEILNDEEWTRLFEHTPEAEENTAANREKDREQP